ncbi:MAG TPA: sugar kinase [Alphaproteobacteria bacterium]|nr:sugar kinase [Alphaproteobacteria bacterium]
MRFVSIGECMIEMSGGEDRLYRMGFAGDTLNTAWYMRALLPQEWTVDYVTALGDDIYSQQMREFFAANGICTAHIQQIKGRRPGLYLIHQAGGDRHFTYWRGQSAAKLLADDPAALQNALDGADVVYFSGITLAILAPRARGQLLKAIVRARNAGARVAFDPNVRPALWTSPQVMASMITAAASISDVVLPTHGDEAPLFGDASSEATAQRYLDLGVEEVAVKNGAEPAVIATRSSQDVVPAPKAEQIVDTTGAGDSFNSGYLASRLMGASPADAAKRAHRIAGVVIGVRGALADPRLLRGK